MKHQKLSIFFFSITFLLFYQTDLYALEGPALEVGEFAQQRLGGRNIAQANAWVLQHAIEYFKISQVKNLLYEIDVVYGFAQNFGLEMFIPINLKNADGPFVSRGMGDIIFDVQWTFYEKGPDFGLIATGVKVPSGSTNTIPINGTGTWDLSIELSTTHFSQNWYASFVIDAIISSKKNGLRFGSSYDYEFILGRVFKLWGGTLTISLDMLGLYLEPDKLFGRRLENTGGNIIFFGPLFSFSYGRMLFDVSYQPVVNQRLFGVQPKYEYTTLASFTVSF